MKSLKIIIYAFIYCFFFTCSNEDDTFNTTFLKKYEGTVWLKESPMEYVFIRFIDNNNTPLEFWVNGFECYYHYTETLCGDNTLTINNEDILEFKYFRNCDQTDYVNIITLKASGNSMELESKFYEDDILMAVEILNYTKSNQDVDSFKICDDQSDSAALKLEKAITSNGFWVPCI